MQVDLSAFGRTESPIQVRGFGQPADTSAPELLPMSIEDGTTQAPLEYPILVPETGLVGVMEQKARLRLYLKYGLLGALGLASGALVAHKMSKSKLIGASIGGLVFLVGTVGVDLYKMGMQASEGLAPITAG